MPHDDRLAVVVIGIGGYGSHYIKWLHELQSNGRAYVCAVVDPFAEQSEWWPRLAKANVPRYNSLSDFLQDRSPADLAIIASPIAVHADQTCDALKARMNVLCEKPMAATIQDATRIQDARDRAARLLEIGYQWSFSKAIQQLKSDVISGRLGAPIRLATCVSWPRSNAYYRRNSWAGRIRDTDGRWVLDSPISNATAHFLHNMLYVLGPTTDRSATPTAITSECYRANAIENFDAACCRIECRECKDVSFFAAHCTRTIVGPEFRFEFDDAIVKYWGDGDIVAQFTNGETRNYGDPAADSSRKLRLTVERCGITHDRRALCGPEAARAHILCVNGMQETPVHAFNPALIRERNLGSDETLTYVPGLEQIMYKGYLRGSLFSEMETSWAHKAERVVLADYVEFPTGE